MAPEHRDAIAASVGRAWESDPSPWRNARAPRADRTSEPDSPEDRAARATGPRRARAGGLTRVGHALLRTCSDRQEAAELDRLIAAEDVATCCRLRVVGTGEQALHEVRGPKPPAASPCQRWRSGGSTCGSTTARSGAPGRPLDCAGRSRRGTEGPRDTARRGAPWESPFPLVERRRAELRGAGRGVPQPAVCVAERS